MRQRSSANLCTEAEDILQDTFSAVEKCLADSGETLSFVVRWEDSARTDIRERIVQRLHDVRERGVEYGASVGAAREQVFRSVVALIAVIAVIGMCVAGLALSIELDTFSGYLAPVTSICAAGIAYWFGTANRRPAN
jgi:hypothetical protein